MSLVVTLVSCAQYVVDYEQGKNAANAPPTWDPTEPYDPRAPNDYYEYKAYKQREREEYLARRQAELREESRGRKRSWKDDERSEDSDDASEDSRDYDRWQNRPRKTGELVFCIRRLYYSEIGLFRPL